MEKISSSTYPNYGAIMAKPDMKENDRESITDSNVFNEFMQRRPSTLNTIFGKIRHKDNIEYFEWIFLIIAILSALASLGFAVERLITLENNSPDFTFALVLFVNILCCLYYVIRGVLQERPLEIFVFVVTNITVTIYVIVNFTMTDTNKLKLVRLILTTIFGSLNIIFGFRYFIKYWNSNNYIFRITPMANLQKVVRIFLFSEGFLIFDIQFQVSLLILMLEKGVEVDKLESILLSVGVVCTVPWIIIGYFALRKESEVLCYIFWIASWITPSYIVYKFVDLGDPVEFKDLKILYSVTLVTCAIALVIRILLIISTVVAFKNFHKGYKEIRYGVSNETDCQVPPNSANA